MKGLGRRQARGSHAGCKHAVTPPPWPCFIACSSFRRAQGLVVPVIRSVDNMKFAEIEKAMGALGVKARDGTLSIDEMAGGTFTISNGGVFGSMLSTPIINPPQVPLPAGSEAPKYGSRRARSRHDATSAPLTPAVRHHGHALHQPAPRRHWGCHRAAAHDVPGADVRPPARGRARGRHLPQARQGSHRGPRQVTPAMAPCHTGGGGARMEWPMRGRCSLEGPGPCEMGRSWRGTWAP